MKTELKLLSRAVNQYGSSFNSALDLTKSDAVKLLKFVNDEYYNNKGETISDEVYDIFKDWFASQWPNHPLAKQVGADTAKGVTKERLLEFMNSLNKLYPGDDMKGFDRASSYTITPKFDGMSLQILYRKGKCVKVLTRGRNHYGENVSGIIPALKVPKTIKEKDDFIVRAEFILHAKGFDKYHKDNGGKFKTARNYAGGLLRRNKPTAAVTECDVVCFEIMRGKFAGTQQNKQLAYLEELGFTVAPHKVVTSINYDKLTELFHKMKKKSKYECDGIVVAQNKPYQIKDENPKHAKAFKINSLENSMVVPIKEIEWNDSQHNTFIPRVVIDPIDLGGVEVKHFTGHNWFYIQNGYTYKQYNDAKKFGIKLEKKPMNVGAMIRVIRSGDVIPYIMEVVTPAQTPSQPKDDYKLDANGVHALVAGTTSDSVKIKRIIHFFVTMGVEGLKVGVVTKLFEAGHNTVRKILRLTVDDIMELDGFKERSAEKLYENIQAVYSNATFARFGYASNVFGKLVGESKLQAVIDGIPNIVVLASKLSTRSLQTKIESVKGIKGTAEIIAERLPKMLELSEKLRIPIQKERKAVVASNRLKDVVVLLTGVRDAKFVADVKAQGGAEGSIKKATHVITKPGNTNQKTEAAEAAGIPIMSIEEFRRKFKL